MISNLVLNVIILFLGALFSWLPEVTTLPSVMGFDIDTALSTGVGQIKGILYTYWYLIYVIGGFLVLLGYFGTKLALRFFLGSRGPAD